MDNAVIFRKHTEKIRLVEFFEARTINFSESDPLLDLQHASSVLWSLLPVEW